MRHGQSWRRVLLLQWSNLALLGSTASASVHHITEEIITGVGGGHLLYVRHASRLPLPRQLSAVLINRKIINTLDGRR